MSLIQSDLDDTHKKIILNIGGMRHETLKSTLRKIPATRLSKLCENPSCYDAQKNEYFFDRHPAVFSQILNYYRTGKLHYPTDVCGPLFEEELRFWDLDSTQVEPCCWMTYTRHRDAEETRNILEAQKIDGYDENDEDEQREFYAKFGVTADELEEPRYRLKLIQIKVWRLFNQPQNSTLAKVVNYITVMCIIISICTFCAGTHPLFLEEQPPLKSDRAQGTEHRAGTNTSSSVVGQTNLEEPPTLISNQYLLYTECICNAWFTFELVVRFVVSPTKLRFVREGVNIIDFLATFNFYVGLVQQLLLSNQAINKDVLDLLSIVRIFRIFKLTRHHPGLKILQLTLKASAGELLLLILFLIFGVVIFSAMVYFAEKMTHKRENCGLSSSSAGGGGTLTEACPNISSIIDWFWWSVVTMTTVGYGDMVPKSYGGMLVGMLCALAGVLTTSLPIPVIVSNFTIFYQHMEARKKLPKNIKRKIAPATMPLKGKTQEKIEQVKQRGRRRAILPQDYSALNNPSFTGPENGDAGDNGGGGLPATSLSIPPESLQALLELSGQGAVALPARGARGGGRRMAATTSFETEEDENDSLLPSDVSGNDVRMTSIAEKRMSWADLLPKLRKKQLLDSRHKFPARFKSSNAIEMQRVEECTDSHAEVFEDMLSSPVRCSKFHASSSTTARRDSLASKPEELANEQETSLYHQQKPLAEEALSGNRTRAISVSAVSLYSMSSIDWSTFEEKSARIKEQRRNYMEDFSTKRRARAPLSNTHSIIPSTGQRLFLKRPGSLGQNTAAMNKYKRLSLQPYRSSESPYSRKTSQGTEDGGGGDSLPLQDRDRAISAAMLARANRSSVCSTGTSRKSSRQESTGWDFPSDDNLSSIPSIISIDSIPSKSNKPPTLSSLRRASMDQNYDSHNNAINIHRFPKSHSFYNRAPFASNRASYCSTNGEISEVLENGNSRTSFDLDTEPCGTPPEPCGTPPINSNASNISYPPISSNGPSMPPCGRKVKQKPPLPNLKFSAAEEKTQQQQASNDTHHNHSSPLHSPGLHDRNMTSFSQHHKPTFGSSPHLSHKNLLVEANLIHQPIRSRRGATGKFFQSKPDIPQVLNSSGNQERNNSHLA